MLALVGRKRTAKRMRCAIGAVLAGQPGAAAGHSRTEIVSLAATVIECVASLQNCEADVISQVMVVAAPF